MARNIFETKSLLWKKLKKIARDNNISYNSSWKTQKNTMISEFHEIHRKIRIININKEILEKTFYINKRKKTLKSLAQGAVLQRFKMFFNHPSDGKKIKLNGDQFEQILDYIRLYNDYNLVLKNGNEYRTINNIHLIQEYKEIFNDYKLNIINQNGSDYDEVIEIKKNPDRKISLNWRIAITKRKVGAFFKYYNTLEKTDFSRYQIYHKKENQSKLNCLQHALLLGGLEEGKFNKLISLFIKNNKETNISNKDKIPKRFLKVIAEELEINIKLSYLTNQKSKGEIYELEKFPKKFKPGNRLFEIALADEHYFINEKTNYTKDSILYYNDLKDKEHFNEYIKKGGKFRKQDSDRFIQSSQLVKLLLDNKANMLELITYQNGGCNVPYKYEELKDYQLLNPPSENECKEVNKVAIPKIPKIFRYLKSSTIIGQDSESGKNIYKNVYDYHKYDIIYFDFEATTDENIHKEYMICSENREGLKKCYIGSKCSLKFLKSIRNHSLLIAHNMKYDLQFIIGHLEGCRDYISTGSKCKTISGYFTNKDTKERYSICIKDSLSLISEPLADFPGMFKLEGIKKEILPYGLYNKDTIDLKYIPIDYAKKYLDLKPCFECTECKVLKPCPNQLNHQEFLDFNKNIKEWNLYDPNNKNYFNHIEYSRIYCEMDVSVLKKGYEKFREWMLEITKFDIDLIISLPQLSYYFGRNEQVFDDIYELSGQSREFIQRCVVGGRTMTRDNKKWHIKDKLNDFDAVSLYPSAMYEMKGFLKGKPKVLSSNQIREFEYLRKTKFDGYFIEIDIIDIKISRNFPLVSKLNDEGVRQFSNDIRGKEIYIDKQGLEDLINFHNIKYKVVRGYYYNEGRNDKIKEFMSFLFNERLKKKKDKNPIEKVYKLIMNSFYGKTIQNPIIHKYKFVYGKKNHNQTFSFNSNTIISSVKIRKGMYMIKESKSINKHYALPHIGVEVLSMSKHIMNRVMTLAEDLDINIYYQDTDSIHIEDSKIKLLGDEFKEKYKKDLIGKNLGQFHSDFNFEGDPVAIESYFLGKKSYLDVISYFENGENKIGYHIKMKGIPSKVIKQFHCKGQRRTTHYIKSSIEGNETYKAIINDEEEFNVKYDNVIKLYDDLYKGIKVKFDLLSSCFMKTNKDFSFSNNEVFDRILKF